MWLLLIGLQEQIPDTLLNPSAEYGVWGLLLTLLAWGVRSWFIYRKETKESRRVEGKLEKEWANGTVAPGTGNTGRTVAQLIEMVHEDLKEHKKECNNKFEMSSRRFDKIHTDIGKIKGKLGID